MIDLIARVEAGTAEQQADLLRAAASVLIGTDDEPTEAYGTFSELRFEALLDLGAWVSAALMLVPEGWKPRRIMWFDPIVEFSMFRDLASATGRAATPALAVCAAALRANGEKL